MRTPCTVFGWRACPGHGIRRRSPWGFSRHRTYSVFGSDLICFRRPCPTVLSVLVFRSWVTGRPVPQQAASSAWLFESPSCFRVWAVSAPVVVLTVSPRLWSRLTREPLAKLLGLAAWRSPQFSW